MNRSLITLAIIAVAAASTASAEPATPLLDRLAQGGRASVVAEYPNLLLVSVMGLGDGEVSSATENQVHLALSNAQYSLQKQGLDWDAVQERRVIVTSADTAAEFARIVQGEYGQDPSSWAVDISDAPLAGEARPHIPAEGAEVELELVAFLKPAT